MSDHPEEHIGDRVRAVRKRRGLSQKELAAAADLSVSLVRKMEQGERRDVRMETAHQLARALDVSTTHLLTKAPEPWRPNVPADIWQPVVTALAAPPPQLPEAPTAAGVSGALAGGRALFATERYDDLGRMLPALLRDVRALEGPQARRLLYQTMQLTVSFLGQVRQYEAAADAAQRTLDASTDALDGAAAVVAQCQQLLRGGHLTEVAELATRWADDVEPRVSKATPQEFAVWGGLQLRIGAAAVRDNRKPEAATALRMARIAAVGLGTEVVTAPDYLRHFGPATVTHQRAEHAAIQRNPVRVLKLHDTVSNWSPARGGGKSGRCRHMLDVADAHLRLHDDERCVHVLRQVWDDAPQWITAQRYAQDIMGRVIEGRRTLTPEMRELADALGTPM
ncbi:helix-turn-helix transcriptional regulator [Streptomyces sp. B8F3]|uniref:helix-turn-helix domain-containing protein n=1 Tax=unclassified Streptomyces TaxID=2593676 RepID=UPI00325DA8B1